MIKVCKEIWFKGNLQAYCKDFDDSNSSKTTTTVDEYVTCEDCLNLIAIEQAIVESIVKPV